MPFALPLLPICSAQDLNLLVLRPRNNRDSLRDIAISKGRIAAIAAKYKDSVDDAVEAGKRANIPVMVDFGYFLPQRPYHELVGKYLRPGLDQIVTPPSKQ